MKSRHRSLSSTISITFLTITLFALLTTGIFQVIFHYRSQSRTISKKQSLIAREASGKVAAYIHDKLDVIKTAIIFSSQAFDNNEQRKDFVDSLLALEPSFRNVVIVDTKINPIGYASRQSTQSLQRFISSAKNGEEINNAIKYKKESLSSIIVDKDTNEPLIVVAIPWYTPLQRVKGVIVVEINLKYMWDLIDSLNVGETGETYVIDNRGRILASKDIGKVIRNEKLDHIPIVKDFIYGIKNSTDIGLYRGISGGIVVGEYIVLENLRWAVITEMSIGEAYIDVINTIIISISFVIMLSIIVIFAGIKVSKYLSQPIMELTNASSKLAQGNMNLEIPLKGSYEIVKLTESFNFMAQKLNNKITDLDNEIKHRLDTEKELKRTRKYISNIINSMPSQIIGVSPDGIITQWNHEAEITTGISSKEAIGHRVDIVLPSFEKEVEIISLAIKTRKEQGHYKRIEYKDGKELYKDIIIYPLIANGIQGAVIRVDDITEKVLLEELIVQSEKMMSVGGMAAGMAHEINNPLAGIMQISEVLSNRLYKRLEINSSIKAATESGTDIKSIKQFMELRGIPKMLDTVHDSCHRVSKIVHNMLSFAKKETDKGDMYSITEILDNCIELSAIDYDLKKNYDFKKIKIIREYEEDIPEIMCHRSKLQQVFMNILKNGAEAMIELTTQGKSFFIIRCRYFKNEKMIEIEIEDNGPGIEQDNQKRIFEPFFTTKGTQKGTGLGLSVSYFIITKSHNGKMFVDSQKGEGTKFTIQLPVND